MASKQTRQLAEYMQAVAEPTRIDIIRSLAGKGKNVGEIAQDVGIEMVNASHHLGVLRTAGVVDNEKRGRFVIYNLTNHSIRGRNLSLTTPGGVINLSLDDGE